MAAAIDILPVASVAALLDLLSKLLLEGEGIGQTWWGSVALGLLFAGYHIGCEIRWGATLGKWLLQLDVVTPLGARPRARVLVPRFLIRYPFVAVDLLTLGVAVPVVGWVNLGLQLGVVAASVATYAFLRQRSLSDLLTRTRVAVRLEPARSTRAASTAWQGRDEVAVIAIETTSFSTIPITVPTKTPHAARSAAAPSLPATSSPTHAPTNAPASMPSGPTGRNPRMPTTIPITEPQTPARRGAVAPGAQHGREDVDDGHHDRGGAQDEHGDPAEGLGIPVPRRPGEEQAYEGDRRTRDHGHDAADEPHEQMQTTRA